MSAAEEQKQDYEAARTPERHINTAKVIAKSRRANATTAVAPAHRGNSARRQGQVAVENRCFVSRTVARVHRIC